MPYIFCHQSLSPGPHWIPTHAPLPYQGKPLAMTKSLALTHNITTTQKRATWPPWPWHTTQNWVAYVVAAGVTAADAGASAAGHDASADADSDHAGAYRDLAKILANRVRPLLFFPFPSTSPCPPSPILHLQQE